MSQGSSPTAEPDTPGRPRLPKGAGLNSKTARSVALDFSPTVCRACLESLAGDADGIHLPNNGRHLSNKNHFTVAFKGARWYVRLTSTGVSESRGRCKVQPRAAGSTATPALGDQHR
jgi:hypothetical protein